MQNEITKSYVHDEKAGNFHDVWKHFFLSEFLNQSSKISQLTFIDAFSGSLIYRNSNEKQLKSGILISDTFLESIPENSSYKEVLEFFKAQIKKNRYGRLTLTYPGSLAIASYYLKKEENRILACDISKIAVRKSNLQFKMLRDKMNFAQEFNSYQSEGIDFTRQYILSNPDKNGVVFIDPPYFPNEHKDWKEIFDLIIFAVNAKVDWTFVIWYCVYSNDLNSHLGYIKELNSLLYEESKDLSSLDVSLQVGPLDESYKKTISGILVLNPKISRSGLVSRLVDSGLYDLAQMITPNGSNNYTKVNISTTGGKA